MSSLSVDLSELGRYPEAEKLARDALDIEQRVNGPESPGAMYAEGELADVLTAEGHYQDAEGLDRETLRAATKANAGLQLGLSWYGLATMSAKAGRHDKAIEYLGHAVDSSFGRPEWIASDPDMKSLHDDPRFDALVAKARQTAAR
jgi:tetratricopeptide (TPR) repeat protein